MKCALRLIVLVLLFATACGAGEPIRMTSLEWAPYAGKHLPGNGCSVEVVRQAFAAVGDELEVVFFPWMRAVETARKDAAFSGYFPEYYARQIEEDFIFSQRIGDSSLGIVHLADRPLTWNVLMDLKPYRIGTVMGYINTTEFDHLVEEGELTVEPAVDDATNLRKLAAGRIDLAVMDKQVFQYLMAVTPELKELGGRLVFNSHLLGNHGLYLCVRKSPEGHELVERFNRGLEAIDYRTVQAACMARYSSAGD